MIGQTGRSRQRPDLRSARRLQHKHPDESIGHRLADRQRAMIAQNGEVLALKTGSGLLALVRMLARSGELVIG